MDSVDTLKKRIRNVPFCQGWAEHISLLVREAVSIYDNKFRIN